VVQQLGDALRDALDRLGGDLGGGASGPRERPTAHTWGGLCLPGC
jgi:hypothetical protein